MKGTRTMISQKVKTAIMALILMLTGAVALIASPYVKPVFAVDTSKVEDEFEKLPGYCSGDACTQRTETIRRNVVNGILYVGGILAVTMIIVGGVQMTTSAGNAAAVAKAKRTIIYSVVGLAVAVLAYAVVNFVIMKTVD